MALAGRDIHDARSYLHHFVRALTIGTGVASSVYFTDLPDPKTNPVIVELLRKVKNTVEVKLLIDVGPIEEIVDLNHFRVQVCAGITFVVSADPATNQTI